MSLNLDAALSHTFNTAALAAANLAAVTIATFDGGDAETAGSAMLQVDTSGGDIDAATMPTTLLNSAGVELLIDGFELTIVKNSVDTNKVTFLDPVTGISFSYVDRQGESITLIFVASNTRWMAKI